MIITDVKAVYPRYQHVAPSWRTHLWQIVVRVESDAGVVGYGYGGGGLAAVEVVNRHLRELLIGASLESVADIATAWDVLYSASIPYGRKGIGIMALSGVDLALWDLLGQAERSPVYDLIGRRSKGKVTAYATGSDPEWYRELGFTAHKFAHRWSGDPADYDTAVRQAARARELFGADARIMIDTYMSWDLETTVAMSGHLADYQIHWFEDVLNPDELEGQAELRNLVGEVNIAGGEHEFSHHGFREIARVGAMDIWQPDITWCGGITAGIRIMDIAVDAGIPVVPHRGAEVWGLHLIAGTACEDLAEYLTGGRDTKTDEVWFGAPVPVDGQIDVLDSPGFGVAPNEALL